jgi:biopolymer transport protein ExbD
VRFGRPQERRFALEKVRLPLVALIDVILFLLIYFVMAGTLAPEESQLASALKTDKQGAGRGSDLTPQIVYVDGKGGVAQFRIGERTMPDRAALAVILKQLPKENGVIVKVAGDVPVAAAAAALQACKDAGFQKVSYVPAR